MAGKMSSFLFLAVLLASTVAVSTGATAPWLYVFGDSSVDVGNNNFLPPHAPKANHPYYGIDYPGEVPTGRFSNGFNSVDYVAEVMKLPMSPPPFLSLANSKQMVEGINFASGGSGILDSTGIAAAVISMNEQLSFFKAVVGNFSARVGNRTADDILSKSLFFVSTGSNDLSAHYGVTGPENNAQMDQFINPVLMKFKKQLMMLYELGARKFAVLGTGLIGCVPVVLIVKPDCLVALNNLSLRFKNATKAALEDLSQMLPGFKYSFLDDYEMGTYMFEQHLQLGFTDLKNACCWWPCSPTPNTTLCHDRRNHVSWDGYHPTQAVYKLIAELALFGAPIFANPINIEQLLLA